MRNFPYLPSKSRQKEELRRSRSRTSVCLSAASTSVISGKVADLRIALAFQTVARLSVEVGKIEQSGRDSRGRGRGSRYIPSDVISSAAAV